MPDGHDRAALKAAVRVILSAVAGIGHIAAWLGQGPDWHEYPGARRAYWEVNVEGAGEAQIDAPRGHRERPQLTVEGWLPWSNDGFSEAAWDALVPLVKDALRRKRALDPGNVQDSDPPQESQNDLRAYATGQEDILCHHVLIEALGVHDFDFTLA